MHKFIVPALAAVIAVSASAVPAHAQAARTYVSGVGDAGAITDGEVT